MRLAHRALRQAEGFAYPGTPIAFNEGQVGFNWFISRPGERRITWTVGLTGGYSSFLGLDIEARRAVVVLTNTGLNNVDYLGFHLLDPTVPLPPASAAPGGEYLAAYPADHNSARLGPILKRITRRYEKELEVKCMMAANNLYGVPRQGSDDERC